ncbi:exosortase Y-associated Wzy-like protein [Pedobacter sp.]|uniref:exosortase Y-associated Wzy-like protein n=1 Tax=Pedobacter sp. TaxID=1411316 RepID=UPI00396C73BE
MHKNRPGYLFFFIPFALSSLLSDTPALSYIIAWLGSFYIFYLTWFSKNRFIKNDLPVASQIMRPIFLLQLIFAGFMCCTSIFYFLDHLGYEYFVKVNPGDFVPNEQTYLIAKCQRICLLAHISLVWGMLYYSSLKKPKTIYIFQEKQSDLYWLRIALFFYITAIGFQFLPGLLQFSIYFNNMAIFSASLLLLKGLRTKKTLWIVYGTTMFGLNFINATLTGFKEHIIVNVIILFALLFPYYKRVITLASIPTIYILLYILPTYASIVRQSWSGEKTAVEARSEALETIFQEDNEEVIDNTNWGFLTNRFSEIGMFTQYVAYVPAHHDFYKTEIIHNALIALIPRQFYPNKPITEQVAMERVYEAGVVSRLSLVSAKTRPVVDAYLSFGYIGTFVFLFLFGCCVQFFNDTAERWFGGYEFGCIVIFNGCFQGLWRGNNFEFMLNNMLYGFITMVIVFRVLLWTGYLTKKNL